MPAASPKPVQHPHPPICIGGSGELRTLRTAARWAQHWNFVGGPVEEFRRKKEILERHCAEVGRDPAEITLSSHVRFDPDLGPGATRGCSVRARGSGRDARDRSAAYSPRSKGAGATSGSTCGTGLRIRSRVHSNEDTLYHSLQ